jgi:DNA-binding transcriptional regulator YiaG
MVGRCHNPNHSSYGRYGAQGVYVCDRWRAKFANFLTDMGERPEGMTLDRIDPRGPSSPGNCRWADTKTQRRNISPEGDRRMREAMSQGVRRRWAEWRDSWTPLTPDQIRSIRKRLGLTQVEIARRIGLGGQHPGDTFRAWEAGRQPISRRKQDRLLALFGGAK